MLGGQPGFRLGTLDANFLRRGCDALECGVPCLLSPPPLFCCSLLTPWADFQEDLICENAFDTEEFTAHSDT